MNPEKAISYLGQNLPLHIDMVEALRRNTAEILFLDDHTCLLRNMESGILQLACDDERSAAAALIGAGSFQLIVAHGMSARNAVTLIRPEFSCPRPCHQGYYPGRERHEPPFSCTIVPFPMKQLDEVLLHYENIRDPSYIVDRIEKGDLFAGYCNDVLCGFIGFHGDGSIGMLEVFPPYRRKHIAFALEQYLINLALERGWTPYCHIFEGNEKSLALQKKLGLIVTDDCPIAWMHARNE